MKKNPCFILFFCITLLSLTTMASADVGGANQVIIQVQTITGGPFSGSQIESPVTGAHVEIYENGQLIYNDTTDLNGTVKVQLEDGIYLFKASAEGLTSDSMERSITESTGITLVLSQSLSLIYIVAFIIVISLVIIFVYIGISSRKRKKKGRKK